MVEKGLVDRDVRGKKRNVIPRSECRAENGSNERDKGNPRQNRLNCNCNWGAKGVGRRNAGKHHVSRHLAKNYIL